MDAEFRQDVIGATLAASLNYPLRGADTK